MNQIDRMVYELYKLTDEEIAIEVIYKTKRLLVNLQYFSFTCMIYSN